MKRHVLLPTLGSSGDVHPFVALGLELQRRGHRATILTNPFFAPLVESVGLEFVPIGSEEAARAAILHPKLWHLREGFRIIAEQAIPAIEQVYRAIERLAADNTVVAFSSLSFGARVAQEKLKIPTASVHLQPSIIRTYGEQGMFGDIRLSARHPRWLKHLLFGLADFLVLDKHIKGPLNQFRASLGLPAVSHVLDRWIHSPQLVIAFFPSWFAAPQPDWPANLHSVGFPLWDQEPSAKLDAAWEFLAEGPPPVIFTPGSAGATMQHFFDESVAAVAQLGLRAMLVTNYPEQVPKKLPRGVRVFDYLPFSQILPHAALLAYHGGIGTLAQAARAGVPHLVVPHGYDQYDSGWRIEQLRLGRSVPHHRYERRRVAHALRGLLDDPQLRGRCREIAQRPDAQSGVPRAADLIEALPAS
jgi:rhamnosyltransferase subunit B